MLWTLERKVHLLARDKRWGSKFEYNRLPPQVVAAKSVKTFQRRLQWGLQQCANNGVAEWQLLYSNLWRQMPLVRLDALFSS